MKNQRGQVIIILLLTMLIALAIGLAVTQRTITDVATSTQSEQASRSLAAAEAALEKILPSCTPTDATCSLPFLNLSNEANAKVTVSPPLPRPNQALEYPPIGKETVAQFWLADPKMANFSGGYTGNSVDLYFGTAGIISDKPAIELNIITRVESGPPSSVGTYKTYRSFYDTDSFRAATNGFTNCPSPNPSSINTSSSPDTSTADRKFLCKFTTANISGNEKLIMLRARILYSDKSQPVAVVPKNNNPLPLQARFYTAKGTTGVSQKTVQVFRLIYVVPQLFDFAIFSASDLTKTGF